MHPFFVNCRLYLIGVIGRGARIQSHPPQVHPHLRGWTSGFSVLQVDDIFTCCYHFTWWKHLLLGRKPNPTWIRPSRTGYVHPWGVAVARPSCLDWNVNLLAEWILLCKGCLYFFYYSIIQVACETWSQDAISLQYCPTVIGTSPQALKLNQQLLLWRDQGNCMLTFFKIQMRWVSTALGCGLSHSWHNLTPFVNITWIVSGCKVHNADQRLTKANPVAATLLLIRLFRRCINVQRFQQWCLISYRTLIIQQLRCANRLCKGSICNDLLSELLSLHARP